MTDSSTPTPILSREEFCAALRSCALDPARAMGARRTLARTNQVSSQARLLASHEALRDALRTAEAERDQAQDYSKRFVRIAAEQNAKERNRAEDAEAEMVRLRAALERIATSNWDEIGTPSIAAVRAFAADSLTATNRCPVCGSTERDVRRGVLMGASSLDGADPCDSVWHDGGVGETTPEPAPKKTCPNCGSTRPERIGFARWNTDDPCTDAFHVLACPTCGSTDRAVRPAGLYGGLWYPECPDAWHGGETPK